RVLGVVAVEEVDRDPAAEILTHPCDEEDRLVTVREDEPVPARRERALRRIHLAIDREAALGRTGRVIPPAPAVAAVDSAVRPDVAEEDARGEGELQRTRTIDVASIEERVRDPRGEMDAEPDDHLVPRTADGAHRSRPPGDQPMASLLLV